MAYIDDVLGNLTDQDAAQVIRAELARIRDRQRFGIFFERHLPEHTALPGTPVVTGARVMRSNHLNDARVYQVTAVEGTTAYITESRGSGDESLVPIVDLVPVAVFGEKLYPGLASEDRVENGPTDRPWNTVINAENHHALEALRYTHRHAVDCIYIDPPYNTGDRDWRYNNDYVDRQDAYRHSKWLAFMERRLMLTRDLLNPASSVLIVTIDAKEVHHLGCLLEQVFPTAVRQLVTIVMNPNGSPRASELTRVEEFAFFVFIGDAAPARVADDLLGEEAKEPEDGLLTEVSDARKSKVRWEWLLRGGVNSNSSRVKVPTWFYPLHLDPETRHIVDAGEPIALDVDWRTITAPPGLILLWPLKTDGREGIWRMRRETFLRKLKAGHVRVGEYNAKRDRWSVLYLPDRLSEMIDTGELILTGRDANGVVQVEYNGTPRIRTAKTVWNRRAHTAGKYGTELVKSLTGRPFPFPKSLYAVVDALRIAVGDKTDAVVLDFFAGSGTTGHAVAKLNAEDGGSRRFILVTNNEVGPEQAEELRKTGHGPGDPAWEKQGIAEQITWPRIRAAVTGQTPQGKPVEGSYLDGAPIADGLRENVEFLRLAYLDPDAVSLGLAFEAISPLLWLKAGAAGPRIEQLSPTEGWALPDDGTYGVLFDTSKAHAFVHAVRARANTQYAFIVSRSAAVFSQIAGELPAGVEAVHLWDDYLTSFEIGSADVTGEDSA
ncbi:site-specific DNA-methyltransferase [Streptomyces prunicolor]|uniref:site-specific DNA-methyltransferase n=1 Tax=Streptomyces prunicolor TaxID=67348 RepID=UPI0037D67C47